MKLELHYVVTEHLAQPSITARRYTFQDASVGYEWSYEGFHPDPKYQRVKKKDAVTRFPQAIVSAVMEQQERLLVNRKVERAAGHAKRSSAIDLRVTLDEVEYRLEIGGPAPDAANPCADTQAVEVVVAALDRALRA